MSDFSVTVGGDFSELLAGFKLVERTAQQSGQAAGQALGGGIQGAVNRSIDALLADLGRLKAQKASVNVDGGQVIVLNQQISAVQKQIDTLRSARVALQSDPRSIDGLNQKLGSLQAELGKVAIGSEKFKQLQGAISATEKELAKAGQSTGGLRALDGIVQGIAFSLANTLTNAAGAAFQALGGIAGQVRQFDSAKAAVRTLGVNADDLGDRLLKLSASTKGNVSAVELLKASYDVASSGFASAADATNILSAAQDGAVGGFTDINTVADATTSVLNAYGLSSDKARKLIDGFIQTQNDGKITVGQYATEIGRIAPVAAASGVSIDELNAAISAATAQGVPVGSTFAGLRQAISSILKPSVEASQYAKTLGLDFSAAALKAKGFGGLMTEVAQKTGGSADAIIKLTGSVEAQAAIQPLVNDGLKKYNQFLANQANSAGVASKAADEATATVDGSLKRLANTFSNLSVQAFQGIAPVVTATVNAFNTILTAVGAIPGPVKTLIAVVVGVPAAFAAATAAVVIFRGVLQTAAIQEFTASFVSLGGTLTTTFVGGVRAAAAALPGLIAQIAAIGATNVGTTIAGIASLLRTTFLNAVGAAATALGNFVVYLTSVSFTNFIAGVRAATIAIAPLALAIGGLIAAVQAWQFVLGGSEEGTAVFVGANAEADKAIARLATSIKATAQEADKGRAPVIGFFQDAREQMAQLAAAQGFAQLQEGFTKVQTGAISFLKTLQSGSSVTAQQAAEAGKYIESLKQIANAAQGTAQALRVKAEEAKRAGNAELAKQYLIQANALDSEARASTGLATALTTQANRAGVAGAATAAQTALTKEQEAAVKERTKAEAELNKIIANAPIRNIEAQLAVGQQLLGLTKAIGDLEQSRFSVTKSALQFELKALEDRGAGEAVIAAKKAEIDRVDRAALSARYQALVQQQALEQQMLLLSQEKARTEANLQILEQKANILKAQSDLAKATSAQEKAAAQAQVNLQQQILGVVEEKAGTLAKTQPIERAIAAATAETAQNGLRAEAAAKGYTIAADGSLVKTKGIASSLERVSILSGASAKEQERFRDVAGQAGLAIGRAADGTLVLGRNQQDVTRAVQGMNGELGKAAAGYNTSTQAAGRTKAETDKIRQSLINAGTPAKDIERLLAGAGTSAKDAKGGTDALRNSLAQGKTPAGDIANAFVSTGKNAPAAAQGARDFAAWLSKAREFAQKVADINLGTKMAAVRDRTREAAQAAGDFFNALNQAAQLPGSRWTGGPVEAGAEYRVNELGQEALLSAGRLSLINAPQNAIWRAPSSGVVVPAGITARLQEAGALPSVGGIATGGGNAELAVEIGKLRQEVGELARRQWNINVTQRTGVSGSQVLRTLQQLR